MILKVIANGLYIGKDSYLRNGWNIIDIFLIIISLIDLIISLTVKSSSKILRILRILRTLRPLRLINKYPGLIQLYQNKENLRSTKNFENAISSFIGVSIIEIF
jgi:hypothetical protein